MFNFCSNQTCDERGAATLSQLSKRDATKFSLRLNESFGQRQRGIYPALAVIGGECYPPHHLPCLNPDLNAKKRVAKVNSTSRFVVQICRTN